MILQKISLSLLLITPSAAMAQEIDCSEGGRYTHEIDVCKRRTLDGLRNQLSVELSSEEIQDLTQTSRRVCSVARESVKQGSIYPIAIQSCMERMMRVVLDEIEGGMKGTGKCF